jgi:hypothetical protein
MAFVALGTTVCLADAAAERDALLKSYPLAAKNVLDKAATLLPLPVKTVMDKTSTASSGDKHDFLTLSPYYWPNISTSDGKPYGMKDGLVNPECETDKYDRVAYFQMADTVKYCAIAWRLTGDAKYAEKAAGVLRAWFVAPETRMNPNLNHAQFVPGINEGSHTGIIRGNTIVELIDCTRLIEDSGAWKPEDKTAWLAWLGDFAKWLAESEMGVAESKALNNHGTWYDAQVATFALEGGNEALAREIVSDATDKRIAKQIKPDGKQPLELARTKSWDYSVMNLDAMVRLATLGKRLDVDLWNYNAPSGGSIRAALDYLLPFATGEKEWETKQIEDFNSALLYPAVRRAAVAFPDGPYAEAMKKFPADNAAVGMDHLMFAEVVR